MSNVLVYLYLILIMLSIGLFFKKELVYAIPLAFIVVSILISSAGCIGDLRIGVYLPVVVSIVLVILVIKKEEGRQYIKQYLFDEKWILIIYTLLFIYVCLYHRSSALHEWDEFQHWGQMVKGMVGYNKLYCYLPVDGIHPEYPPLLQSFEYLFCYLKGGYFEPELYKAVNIACFSMMFPILRPVYDSKKQIRNILVFVLLALFVNTINYTTLSTIYGSINLDMPIVIAAGVTTYMIMIDHKEEKITIAFFLYALLLLKDIGIAFYLINATLILLFLFKEDTRKKKIEDIVIYVVVPLLILVGWKLYIKDIGITQFSLSKINVPQMIDWVINKNGPEDKMYVINTYKNQLFDTQIIAGIVNLTFTDSMMILFPILLILYNLVFANDKYKKYTSYSITVLAIIGFCLLMFTLYLFCFDFTNPDTDYNCFRRYFGSFAHYLIILASALTYYLFVKHDKTAMLLIMFMLIGLFSRNNLCVVYKNSHQNSEINDYRYKAIENEIVSNDIKDSRIIVVSKDYRYHKVRYAIFDKQAGNKILDSIIRDSGVDTNGFKNGDYIFIFDLSDQVYDTFKRPNGKDIEEGKMYIYNNGVLEDIE